MRVLGMARHARAPLGRELERLAIWLAVIAVVLFYALGAHAQVPTPTPTPHVRKAFYVHLTPTKGGPSCLVGPWFTYAAAADWDGSALYSHPFACHLSGPVGGNCRNLGNGYAYTKGTPYPPPLQIPDSGPVLLPFVATGQHGRWVRFWYGTDGSCTVVIQGKPRPTLPPGQFTDVPIHGGMGPGYPWLYIGDTGGPFGDGVWE